MTTKEQKLQINRKFNRAKIVESLRELAQNTRRNSGNFHTDAIQFYKIHIDADRILKEIYGD